MILQKDIRVKRTQRQAEYEVYVNGKSHVRVTQHGPSHTHAAITFTKEEMVKDVELHTLSTLTLSDFNDPDTYIIPIQS